MTDLDDIDHDEDLDGPDEDFDWPEYDPWFLAGGRTFYRVYQGEFVAPEIYVYGLTPDATRFPGPDVFDIRDLPPKYHVRPLEIRPIVYGPDDMEAFLADIVLARAETVNLHALVLAAALADGYDFEALAARSSGRDDQPATLSLAEPVLEVSM